jgi:hypothetical protein
MQAFIMIQNIWTAKTHLVVKLSKNLSSLNCQCLMSELKLKTDLCLLLQLPITLVHKKWRDWNHFSVRVAEVS